MLVLGIDSVYMNTNEDRPKGRVTIKQQNKKIHSVAEDRSDYRMECL